MLDLIRLLFRRHPGRAFTVLGLELGAAVAEVITVATLLPVLLVLTVTGTGTDSEIGEIGAKIKSMLAAIGIPQELSSLLLLMVAAVLVKAVLTFVFWNQIGAVTAAVGADIRERLLRALAQARWSYFVDQSAGSLTNAIGTQALRAADAFKTTCDVLSELIQLFIYIALVLWVAPLHVTAGAVLIGVILFTTMSRVTVMRRDAERRETRALEQLSTRMTDALRSFKSLKAMGVQDYFIDLLRHEVEQIQSAERLSAKTIAFVRASSEPLLAIMLAIGLYISVVHLKVPGAELLFIAMLFIRTAGKAVSLQRNYHALAGKEVIFRAMERVIALAESQADPLHHGRAVEMERSIKVDDVSFGYRDTLVLNQVNAEIGRGKLVVIRGPSGAGKTTLIDILIGLYAPQSGSIEVDGVPFENIDIAHWRQRIGYVPQDSMMLHESVAHNVTLGRQSLGEADIETALKRAEALDFVNAMPKGMQSSIGEHGGRLSGGQRQRIALARALVHRPHLLILDEPTSALDSAVAADVVRTLERLAHEDGVTILAVTHHQLVAEAADVLYDMVDGRLRVSDAQVAASA